MSQHFYDTKFEDKEVEVLIGWDSPLQRFFLVIEYKNEEDYNEEDDVTGELVYSNLTDNNLPDGDSKYLTLDYFKSVLNEHNITLPDEMFTNVLADKQNNVGNKEVKYT